MLAILLKILSIIGIVLLILLGIILVLLILVLFFPITYKIHGNKKAEDIIAKIKINWLFGLLRFRFLYPEPGNAVVKFLCFKIYDSKKEPKNNKRVPKSTETKPSSTKEATEDDVSADAKEPDIPNQVVSEINISETDAIEQDSFTNTNEKKSILQRISEKYNKIKYTIQKIYDKMKYILRNILYYKELLQEEETKALLKHAWTRLVKILKRICPKKLKADILFGAETPDTTGYVMAVYGMLLPHIRKPCDITFTPDFSQAVLEGEINAKGNITVFCILINLLPVLFDKRLRILIHKIKKYQAKQNKA